MHGGNSWRWLCGWLGLVALCGLQGCSSSGVKIAGKVLLKQQPVSGAVLDFALLDDKPKLYRGVSLADGTYQIDYGADGGLVAGKYRVTVTVTETQDGKPSSLTEEGAAALAAGRAVSRSYTFEKEIADSSNTFDLNLDGITPVEAEAP